MTNSNKKKIYENRINTTSKLVDAISLLNKKIHLINTSAIGIVLSKKSVMIKKLVPFFKFGAGGKIGNGKQWMSFIHIYDLVHSIRFIIEKELEGIVNITAPNNTTNIEFTKEIASLMHKPAFLTVPVFMLKLLYGKGAKIIYSGHRVFPEKLLNQGYKFKFPDINSALEEIVVH